MRAIEAFAAAFLLFMAGAAAAPANPAFAPIEIRLVAQKPARGAAVAVPSGERMLEVELETLLGPADFVAVGDVEWVEGKPGFTVRLTADGAKKYEQVSTNNVGRTLAIIVDGKVLMTPRILDPVRAEGFLLTVNTESEARELAAKVRRAVASG